MFVVAAGNPFDGMPIFGPFEDAEDANSYAETELERETWWVMELKSPGRKFWSPQKRAPMTSLVATGTAFTGLTLHGPFASPGSASQWARTRRGNWSMATVELLQEP